LRERLRLSMPSIGRQRDRESDRLIRPLRPGNAGGGKEPDFRHALEEDENRDGDW
jgi:hypothetical protein